MCGIAGILNRRNVNGLTNGIDLLEACKVINHRGPDDEGFLTWNLNAKPEIWAGRDTAESTRAYWNYPQLENDKQYYVGLGHRRLSILDLSPAGHQPMLFEEGGLAIVFNGEIYNYLEIKVELQNLGHKFKSQSDTEVILHAWQEWSANCLSRFNGMFSFIILDYKKSELYAVRDRFGVKPLYYYSTKDCIFFASEIKQIRSFKLFRHDLNEQIIQQYLATGAVDHTDASFDKGVQQLPGGHYIRINLSEPGSDISLHQWYQLKPDKWTGNWEDAVAKFRFLLTDSVKLRLRSDVKVGSCLSGGLDSSSIVCLAADLLKADGDFAGQETVTACYDDLRYDEWKFAEEVVKKTGANANKTFPTFSDLKNEIDSFLWHQDEPTGSTSQFSQWAVFKKTHDIKLKVMIDGQGADEQLAGYGGNDLSYYAGLLRKARLLSIFDEAAHYKKEKGTPPYGFLLGAFQLASGPVLSGLLPDKYRIDKYVEEYDWLKGGTHSFTKPAKSLQENLLRQVYQEPLPALLRYEDRNSMAWSVESRTPFMDYRLLEFNLGLPERYIYHRGVRKRILRSAMKGVIPDAISNRTDKMGFVTPEEQWIRKEDSLWFRQAVGNAIDMFPQFFDKDKTMMYLQRVIEGAQPFDFSIWRIVCLGKWYAGLNKMQ
jgi:asparagine synthase (glutamine-hydrolysing)